MTAGAPAFRCAAASLESAEPLEGTASTVRSFLLLEHQGPWGVHALQGERLAPAVRDWLGQVEARGMRPLLIRKAYRSTDPGTQLFTAHAGGPTPVLSGAALETPLDLLDLDPDAVAAGTAGLRAHEEPLFLACTHGKHDACCAELGRPLAAALSAVTPEETWEVSHIGGDRFAPNVLVLPHGLYYGRLLPSEAAAFVEAHRAGRLDLEHLRGRSSYPFAVQAAEVHLRRHLDHSAIGPWSLRSQRREGDETTAVFEVDGATWQVKLRTHRSEPAQLTCRSTARSAAPRHVLLGIEPLEHR